MAESDERTEKRMATLIDAMTALAHTATDHERRKPRQPADPVSGTIRDSP